MPKNSTSNAEKKINTPEHFYSAQHEKQGKGTGIIRECAKYVGGSYRVENLHNNSN